MRKTALLMVPALVALSLPACSQAQPAVTTEATEWTSEPTTEPATTALTTQPWWETACDDDLALPETTLVPRTLPTETETETETRPTATTKPSTTSAATTTRPPETTQTTTTTTQPTTEAVTETTTAVATTKPSTTTATKQSTTAQPTDTTTAKASTKAAQTVRAAGSAREAFNQAALHPMKTNNAELDERVQTILSSITTPSMPTYDKVKAIYDYILSHVEYGRNSLNQSDELNAYATPHDAVIVLSALDTLNEGVGVCDDYAALFLVMTRAVGLDCRFTTGSTTNTKGEKKDHAWNTIMVGGTAYLFDAQVEDKQSANGVKYTFFCKTYDDSIVKTVYSDYDHAADKAAFGSFKRK